MWKGGIDRSSECSRVVVVYRTREKPEEERRGTAERLRKGRKEEVGCGAVETRSVSATLGKTEPS